ncbi:MAG TPA: fatty acid--CoA ligase family protein [Candidatus Binatia bacterium]|nr:fatty acid--CoA ligase family protein [Candidatus Binatia bacterium]
MDASGAAAWSLTSAQLLARAAVWRARFDDAGLRPGDAIALALSRGPELAPLHLAALAGAHPIVPINTAMTGPEVARVLGAARPAVVIGSAAFVQMHGPSFEMRGGGAPAFETRGGAAAFLETHADGRAASVETHGGGAAAFLDTHADGGAAWWSEESAAPSQWLLAPPPSLAPVPAPSSDRSPASRDQARSVPSLEVVGCADGHAALIIFTSGTTGAPKSVPLSHGNLLSNLETLATLWGRTRQDRLLHVLPAHHFHGLVLALYGSLLAGSRIVMLPGFEPAATLAALEAFEIDVLMAVPTIYSRLVHAAGSAGSLARLRLAISGSAPLPATLWEEVRDHLGAELVNRYGLTETGIVTSMLPGHARAGTVGAPLPGTRIALRTDDGRYHERVIGTASPRGEICITGPGVTAGYGNAPEANAAAFADGCFHSGDLGHFDEQGDLWVDGRIKELIIVGGSNVVPGEVEAPLSAVEGVAELVAAGVPHADLGEVVGAFVVARGGADLAALEERLRDAADKSLAAYKRPRHYCFLEEIPRNAMGKVDRSRLG